MPVDVTAAIMVQGGLFITLYDEETLQLYLDRGTSRSTHVFGGKQAVTVQ